MADDNDNLILGAERFSVEIGQASDIESQIIYTKVFEPGLSIPAYYRDGVVYAPSEEEGKYQEALKFAKILSINFNASVDTTKEKNILKLDDSDLDTLLNAFDDNKIDGLYRYQITNGDKYYAIYSDKGGNVVFGHEGWNNEKNGFVNQELISQYVKLEAVSQQEAFQSEDLSQYLTTVSPEAAKATELPSPESPVSTDKTAQKTEPEPVITTPKEKTLEECIINPNPDQQTTPYPSFARSSSNYSRGSTPSPANTSKEKFCFGAVFSIVVAAATTLLGISLANNAIFKQSKGSGQQVGRH